MSREEYISELRARIAHLPSEERDAAMSYYIEYLQDANDKTMEEIIIELGTPRDVAERIIADCAQNRREMQEDDKTTQGCLIGALALITSPVWLVLVMAVGAIGFAVLITMVTLVLVFGFVALLFLALGVWSLFIYPATGILVLGGSFIMAALTMLMLVLFSAAGVAMKKLVALFKKRRRA